MQRSFDAAGPLDVNVHLASGTIEIDTTADGGTEVELVAHDDDSQQLVDDARVELHGSELVVNVPQRRGGFSFGSLFGGRGITCHIRCPQGSSLRARTKSADVRVHGDLNRADVATASGDVELGAVAGELSAKAASGDVTAGSVGGRASVNTASGDVSLGPVRGPVSVNTASGDVSIDAADDDVKSNTASGDISIAAVARGELRVNSASGDVRIGVRRGSRVYLDCSTVSGDTSSDLELTGEEPAGDGPLLELHARTVSGDIKITRAPAPAESTQEVHA